MHRKVSLQSFSMPRLLAAIKKGNSDIVKRIINSQKNNHILLENGYTLLHKALVHQRNDVARLLIEIGVQLNHSGVSLLDGPLHIALDQGNCELVSLLLEHGADVNARNSKGMTPLMIALTSKFHDNTYLAKQLLLAGAAVCDGGNDSILHLAVRTYDLELISMILDRGADINAENRFGEIPLLIAMSDPHGKSVAKLLLNRGAQLNKFISRGFYNTPLHCAVMLDDVEMTLVLLDKGADINRINNMGKTALHLAVEVNCRYLVEMLLNRGADINHCGGDEPPLFTALKEGYDELARYLVRRGASIHFANKKGYTALHKAVKINSVVTMKVLLNLGLAVNAATKRGLQAIHFAVCRSPDCVPSFKHSDASREKSFQLVSQLVDVLLKYGADINAKDNYGRTPLVLAVSTRNEKVVQFLIERGADVNKRHGYGSTALHVASRLGEKEITRILLENHADPNIQLGPGVDFSSVACLSDEMADHFTCGLRVGATGYFTSGCGETALHLALKSHNYHITKILLNHWANVNIITRDKLTPLHYYIEYVEPSERFRISSVDPLSSYLISHSVALDIAKVIPLSLVNKEILEELKCRPHSSSSIFEAYAKALNECSVARTKRLTERCTYYNFLMSGPSSLLNLCNNRSVNDAFECYSTGDSKHALVLEMFPIYGGLMLSKYKYGRTRRQLFDKAVPFLERHFEKIIPLLVCETILSYLTNVELDIFIRSFD